MTGKSVYVTTDYREKQLQRALLQFSKPENANLVREALKKAGREDLIGTGGDCLVRPAFMQNVKGEYSPRGKRTPSERGMKTQPRPKRRGTLTEKTSKNQKPRAKKPASAGGTRKNRKK